MSYNSNVQKLLGVAGELEDLVADLPVIGSPAGHREDWMQSHQRHRDAAEALAERLRNGPWRATISGGAGGGAHRMSMLGVRTTCTSGLAGLFRNWIAAARKAAR